MAWIIPAITAAGSLAGGIGGIVAAVRAGGGTAKTTGGGGGPPPKDPNPVYYGRFTPAQQATGMPDPEGATAKKMGQLGEMGATGLANPYVGTARGQQDEMRQKYLEALGALGARARGENSVVDAQAQVERERAKRTFLSQLATMSGQGLYNPGAARAAQAQSSGFQQSIAGTVAAAKAKEIQDAETAYLQAIGAGRGQDLSLMGKELEQEKQRQAFYAAMEGLSQGYAGMDLQNKLAQQAGQQSYEQFLADLYLRSRQGGDAIAAQQNLANQQLYGQLGVAGLNAASGALGTLGSMYRTSNTGGSGNTGSGGDSGTSWWDWPKG